MVRLRWLWPVVALVLVAAAGFWYGKGCGERPAVDREWKQWRGGYLAVRDTLDRQRLAWEVTMQELGKVRQDARNRRADQEKLSHVHVRKAQAHADTASELEATARPDTANPWYVVAMQRQQEAQEERLARVASDSALDEAMVEIASLEQQLQETLERLATAERAIVVADTALQKAEKAIRQARRESGAFKAITGLSVLLLIIAGL